MIKLTIAAAVLMVFSVVGPYIKFMEELMKLVKDRDTHVSNYMKEE